MKRTEEKPVSPGPVPGETAKAAAYFFLPPACLAVTTAFFFAATVVALDFFCTVFFVLAFGDLSPITLCFLSAGLLAARMSVSLEAT